MVTKNERKKRIVANVFNITILNEKERQALNKNFTGTPEGKYIAESLIAFTYAVKVVRR